MERVWAWLVHAYTTAGVVLALLMMHFAYPVSYTHLTLPTIYSV